MQANVMRPVRLTETGVVMNAPGYLTGVCIQPNGVNAITVTLRDNAASGAGTYLAPVFTLAGTDGPTFISLPNVWCKAGIHVTLAGDGTKDVVVYCKKR